MEVEVEVVVERERGRKRNWDRVTEVDSLMKSETLFRHLRDLLLVNILMTVMTHFLAAANLGFAQGRS